MQKTLRLSGLNYWFGSALGPEPGLCDPRVSPGPCESRIGEGSQRFSIEGVQGRMGSFAGAAPAVAEG